MIESGTELLILGIIRRAPTSAYSVDQFVRGHAHLYRSLKFGNIYGALRRLFDDGLLDAGHAKAARGAKETKTIFRLSTAGNRRFKLLLTNVMKDVQSSDSALEIGFVLLGQLLRDEAAAILVERLKSLSEHEKRLKRLRGEASEKSGAGYLSASHAYRRVHCEVQFVQEAIQLMRDPKWSPQWSESEVAVEEFAGEAAAEDYAIEGAL